MRHSALLMLALAGTALGGCATASSSSFTQAPLFLSIEDQGTAEVAGEQPLAPYGTLDRGVANYNIAGGNALLPVRAVQPLDAGVQANLLGTPVGVAATVRQGGALNTGIAIDVGAVGVAANVNNGTATTVLAVPGNTNTTVLSPGLSLGPSPLITAGPVLGNAAAATPPVVSNAAGLITTTATDLTRLCALRPCR
jgi:hypothetical protein